ncbi:MAG: hypothetical protein L3J06_06845 [Cyclobacteriaceae bacterium]|nr:hypothetical protein [Cyclobacteriaceae bacterium]
MRINENKEVMEKSNLMIKLRELLLEEDRINQDKLTNEVQLLKDELNTRSKLELKIDPIVEDHLNQLQKNFPTLFGPVITETIKYQIKHSQDEVVDVLYPIIGKLIKKYIVREIELLSEKVDTQLEIAFSWKGWVNRFKAWFSGSKETDIVLRGVADPIIEEVFVIEQNSGLLYGSYSRNKTMDQDMIAGMLTAIKSFVMEAFKNGEQELEGIEYETYHILFKSFKKYFLAVAVSGTVTASFKDKLDTTILNFANNLRKQAQGVNNNDTDVFSGYLEQYFK